MPSCQRDAGLRLAARPGTSWGCEGSSLCQGVSVLRLPEDYEGCDVCSTSFQLMANLIKTPAAWTPQNISPSSNTC